MKKHVLWLALAVAVFVIGAAYLLRRKTPPMADATPERVTATPASASPYAPPPNQVAPPKPDPLVAIQDGKTIDFSSGNPIVKDTAAEKAIIDKALREMEAALQDVKFTMPAPATPAAKSGSAGTPPGK